MDKGASHAVHDPRRVVADFGGGGGRWLAGRAIEARPNRGACGEAQVGTESGSDRSATAEQRLAAARRSDRLAVGGPEDSALGHQRHDTPLLAPRAANPAGHPAATGGGRRASAAPVVCGNAPSENTGIGTEDHDIFCCVHNRKG